MYLVKNRSDMRIVYTDLIGLVPFEPNTKINYVLVAYQYNGNLVMAQALKNLKTETVSALW